MTGTKVNKTRIGMITNAIPENLVLLVYKSEFVNGVVMSQRTLSYSNGELVEYHIIPVFPKQRTTVLAVVETHPRNMELRNVPRNAAESKPKPRRGKEGGMTSRVAQQGQSKILMTRNWESVQFGQKVTDRRTVNKGTLCDKSIIFLGGRFRFR
jgi:hypothetical protein